MADFNAHLRKAQENLDLIQHLEKERTGDLDWKVTLCFYTALHLMNAYMAREKGWHYKTHNQVDNALNPFGDSELKLDETTYTSYTQLYKISRRARYLCNPDAHDEHAHFIENKHHKKAIKHLDKLMVFFGKKYSVVFEKYCVNNIYFKNSKETQHLVFCGTE